MNSFYEYMFQWYDDCGWFTNSHCHDVSCVDFNLNNTPVIDYHLLVQQRNPDEQTIHFKKFNIPVQFNEPNSFPNYNAEHYIKCLSDLNCYCRHFNMPMNFWFQSVQLFKNVLVYIFQTSTHDPPPIGCHTKTSPLSWYKSILLCCLFIIQKSKQKSVIFSISFCCKLAEITNSDTIFKSLERYILRCVEWKINPPNVMECIETDIYEYVRQWMSRVPTKFAFFRLLNSSFFYQCCMVIAYLCTYTFDLPRSITWKHLSWAVIYTTACIFMDKDRENVDVRYILIQMLKSQFPDWDHLHIKELLTFVSFYAIYGINTLPLICPDICNKQNEKLLYKNSVSIVQLHLLFSSNLNTNKILLEIEKHIDADQPRCTIVADQFETDCKNVLLHDNIGLECQLIIIQYSDKPIHCMIQLLLSSFVSSYCHMDFIIYVHDSDLYQACIQQHMFAYSEWVCFIKDTIFVIQDSMDCKG